MTEPTDRWVRLARWVVPPAPDQARQRRSRVPATRAYGELAAVYLLGFGPSVVIAISLLVNPGQLTSNGVPTLGGQLANVAADAAISAPGLVLAWWLAHRRGWTWRRLGIAPRWAAGAAGFRQGCAIGCVMFTGLFVAGVTLHLVAPDASFPHGPTGAWGVIGGLSDALRSAFAEEFVVTAFVITTLRQARRPWPEILVVSLALRTAFHVYYGSWWILLWVLIWAGTAFGLYWRTRRLTPLIVAHFLWDAQGFVLLELGHVGTAIVGIGYLLAIGGGLTLLLVGLADASSRRRLAAGAQTSSR